MVLKKYKNIFHTFFCIIFCLNLFGCTVRNNAQKPNINIATLKGPTGLGMIKIMDDNVISNKYNISVLGDPNDITARLISGEIDIATIPTNMATMIYNKTGGAINAAAVNTLGVAYILSNNNNINSISDLKGEKIFISGKGATPEFVFKYILNQNSLDSEKDVTIEYKAEHSELAALAVAEKVDTVLLPEPFVTQVLNKNPKYKIKIDLTEEWNKLQQRDGSSSLLTMGCIVARKDFIERSDTAFKSFLSEYESSVNFVNSNIEKAAELSEKHDIMPKQVAMAAIPKCNIVFIGDEEMRSKINGFLSVMFEFEPKSVGGSLPDEKFYYKK